MATRRLQDGAGFWLFFFGNKPDFEFKYKFGLHLQVNEPGESCGHGAIEAVGPEVKRLNLGQIANALWHGARQLVKVKLEGPEVPQFANRLRDRASELVCREVEANQRGERGEVIRKLRQQVVPEEETRPCHPISHHERCTMRVVVRPKIPPQIPPRPAPKKNKEKDEEEEEEEEEEWREGVTN